MPVDLATLLAPSRAALVTQEAQRGVIGDLAALPMLAEAVRATGALGNMGRLAAAARDTGVQVVHCIAKRRSDLKGGNTNARLFAAMAKVEGAIVEGTPAVEVVPEIGTEPEDLVLSRYHGLGPMGGTDLDAVLRNLGVTTVVGIGVSVNVGMLDFAFDAVNAGYQFVLPRDAVAGFPPEYADAVIEHTLGLVATVTTTDEIIETWRSA